MCLRQAKAVSIEGHPLAEYNDLYAHDSTHEGWPVLKNARGNYCYRHTPNDSWFLRDRFTPDEDQASAFIVAKEGPLPVGAQAWQLGPSTLGTADWEGRTLTVGLLVRPPLPSPAACASLPAAHRCPARAERAPPPRPWQILQRKTGLLGDSGYSLCFCFNYFYKFSLF